MFDNATFHVRFRTRKQVVRSEYQQELVFLYIYPAIRGLIALLNFNYYNHD
jgi:hypothetical protein